MFFVFLKMLPFFMRKSEHANSEGATMRSVYCSLRAGHANSDWATMRNVAFYYLIIATNKLMYEIGTYTKIILAKRIAILA